MKKSQGKIGVSWRNQKKMRKKCESFFTEKLKNEKSNQKSLEEFLKEAEEIEKEAEEVSKSLECEPTEEGFQKLMAEIRRREFIEETDNDVKNVDDREKDTSKSNGKARNARRKRILCSFSAAAAILIGVFGISMSSEANRAYLIREINELFGNDVNTQVNNDKILKSDRTEEYDWETIENTLGIKMPKFFYLPNEMNYEQYIINEDAETAVVQYDYGEQYIYFMVMANSKSAVGLSQNDRGKMLQAISSELTLNLEVILWEIYEADDKKPTYTLTWNYKNIYCELFGKLPMKEMEEIAKNILY